MADKDADLSPRHGMPSPKLPRETFRRRYLQQFVDPAFDRIRAQLDEAADIAWDAYANSRKAPFTRKAGPGFHDPSYDLAIDWLQRATQSAEAQRRYDDRSTPPILLINGSSRSEHTCPGEMSKSYRLVEIAREVVDHDARCRGRGARPVVAWRRNTGAAYPSLQGVLLDRGGALSLAMLLLSRIIRSARPRTG